MNSDHDRIVWSIAGYGLDGARLEGPRSPLEESTWRALLQRATDERLLGFLARAVAEGSLPVSDAQRHAAVERYEQHLAVDLLLERQLLTICETLDDAGIASRVLKGSAVAHSDYPNPALRSFGDVDLLVTEADFDDTVEILSRGAARRRFPEPWSGFDRRFGKGVCIEASDGFEIDIHRSLVAGPFGLAIDTDELFAARGTFSLAGRALPCLDPEARFLHACFHAVLGSAEPRLVPLRDVAQILRNTGVDSDRVLRLSSTWRCGVVVQQAIALARETFGSPTGGELVTWARGYDPPSFERRALNAYVGSGRSYARQAAAGLRAIPGLRNKIAYARALLLPDRSYVRERDGGYVRRLERGVRLFAEDWRRR